MAGRFSEMLNTYARPGRIEWIGLCPARLGALRNVDAARLLIGGPEGDHGRAGKRAVTLIQAEHLAVIGAFLGTAPVLPEIVRRNIVVSGLNLNALKGRDLRLGGARIRITTICAPCSRMEKALGRGGYSAMRGHGGWCAEVLAPGDVAVGDEVSPVDGPVQAGHGAPEAL